MQPTVTEHSTSRLLLLSFLGTILVGAFLLSLPMSWANPRVPVSWLDALFTATSAVCVTGLTVIDTGTTFSMTGQTIILILIQVGGLGILTFSTFFITRLQPRRQGMDISQRMLLETSHGTMMHVTPKRLLTIILLFTVLVELLGSIGLFLRFSMDFPPLQAAWLAMFHAVSAFCNAGFSLFANNLMDYRTDWTINLVIMGLIVLGGLGFIVAADLLSWGRARLKNSDKKLSLHSQLVGRTTLFLILLGGISIAGAEWNNQAIQDSFGSLFLDSFFLSITSRTAGFNTVAIEQLTNTSLFLIIFLMIIGGSPGSTAGGIKTTTVAVCYALLRSRAKNRPKVECLERSLPDEIVSRSLLIVTGYILVIIAGTLLLQLTQDAGHAFSASTSNAFLAYLFETVSALGTVGLTTGLTPHLTLAGKLVIITLMFVGRLGPLLLATVLLGGAYRVQYTYPQENINIG